MNLFKELALRWRADENYYSLTLITVMAATPIFIGWSVEVGSVRLKNARTLTMRPSQNLLAYGPAGKSLQQEPRKDVMSNSAI